MLERLESRTLFAAVTSPDSLAGYYIDFTSTSAQAPFTHPDFSRATFASDGKVTIKDLAEGDEDIGDYTYTPDGRVARANLSETRGAITVTIRLKLTFATPYGGTYIFDAALPSGGVSQEKGNFLIFPQPGTGTIRGTIYEDVNGDAKRADNDAALAGIRVFLDRNGNGRWDKAERTRFTDNEGHYAFKNINSGYHKLRVGVLPDHRVTNSGSGMKVVTLLPGTTANDRNFPMTQIPFVAGHSVQDDNGDGVISPGDAAGSFVYIDANNSGRFDFGDRQIGPPRLSPFEWSFSDLTPGVYIFRVHYDGIEKLVQPAKGFYKVDLRPGAIVTDIDFLVTL